MNYVRKSVPPTAGAPGSEVTLIKSDDLDLVTDARGVVVKLIPRPGAKVIKGKIINTTTNGKRG